MRKLILTIVALGCVAAAAATQQEDAILDFRVLLDNKPIGFHQFELSHDDTGLQITSTARFDVKLLFITAFKYRHNSTELWKNNCLISIDARTNSNGKQQEVAGVGSDSTLEIQSTAGSRKIEGCVQTFAYWNPGILEATQLLNSQTGDYVDVNVSSLGSERVEVNGKFMDARKYTIRSPVNYAGETIDITLWYAPDSMRWLALESVTKGDRTLRYEKLDPPNVQG